MNRPVLFDAEMSPAGRRVRMALTIEDVDYERVRVDLALMDQKSRYYLEINPTGVVPTLLSGGNPAFDSHEIVDHILIQSKYESLLNQEVAGFDRGCLKNIERSLAQIMRPAVYETIGKQRLKSRFESWSSLESTLIERYVKLSDRNFVESIYFKSYGNEVVDTVAFNINAILQNIYKLLSISIVTNSSLISYFDICLGPRLYAIDKLGLDHDGIIAEYVANLVKKDLWLSTDNNIFDQEFINYTKGI